MVVKRGLDHHLMPRLQKAALCFISLNLLGKGVSEYFLNDRQYFTKL